MCSQNQYDAGVAINGLSVFITPDLARDLANDAMNLVSICDINYFYCLPYRDIMARGQGGRRGHGPSSFIKTIRFSELLVPCQKICILLLLVEIKVLDFIGKCLNLPPPTLQVPQWPCYLIVMRFYL